MLSPRSPIAGENDKFLGSVDARSVKTSAPQKPTLAAVKITPRLSRVPPDDALATATAVPKVDVAQVQSSEAPTSASGWTRTPTAQPRNRLLGAKTPSPRSARRSEVGTFNAGGDSSLAPRSTTMGESAEFLGSGTLEDVTKAPTLAGVKITPRLSKTPASQALPIATSGSNVEVAPVTATDAAASALGWTRSPTVQSKKILPDHAVPHEEVTKKTLAGVKITPRLSKMPAVVAPALAAPASHVDVVTVPHPDDAPSALGWIRTPTAQPKHQVRRSRVLSPRGSSKEATTGESAAFLESGISSDIKIFGPDAGSAGEGVSKKPQLAAVKIVPRLSNVQLNSASSFDRPSSKVEAVGTLSAETNTSGGTLDVEGARMPTVLPKNQPSSSTILSPQGLREDVAGFANASSDGKLSTQSKTTGDSVQILSEGVEGVINSSSSLPIAPEEVTNKPPFVGDNFKSQVTTTFPHEASATSTPNDSTTAGVPSCELPCTTMSASDRNSFTQHLSSEDSIATAKLGVVLTKVSSTKKEAGGAEAIAAPSDLSASSGVEIAKQLVCTSQGEIAPNTMDALHAEVVSTETLSATAAELLKDMRDEDGIPIAPMSKPSIVPLETPSTETGAVGFLTSDAPSKKPTVSEVEITAPLLRTPKDHGAPFASDVVKVEVAPVEVPSAKVAISSASSRAAAAPSALPMKAVASTVVSGPFKTAPRRDAALKARPLPASIEAAAPSVAEVTSMTQPQRKPPRSRTPALKPKVVPEENAEVVTLGETPQNLLMDWLPDPLSAFEGPVKSTDTLRIPVGNAELLMKKMDEGLERTCSRLEGWIQQQRAKRGLG